MRVSNQALVNDVTITTQLQKNEVSGTSSTSVTENSLKELMAVQQQENGDQPIPKEKVQKAVDALNEFMTLHNRNSKFVMHDGLDRYFVQVVDSKTEEVIREVPPRKLLDAYYTMQKFLGMIVDEKI